MTCCFPSIAVENVKTTMFFPSFRFKVASCSGSGVFTIIFFLGIFGLGTSSSLSPPVFFEISLAVFTSSSMDTPEFFMLLDLLKAKDHDLQLLLLPNELMGLGSLSAEVHFNSSMIILPNFFSQYQ